MEGLKSGEPRVDAGTTILLEGSDAPHVHTVLDGIA